MSNVKNLSENSKLLVRHTGSPVHGWCFSLVLGSATVQPKKGCYEIHHPLCQSKLVIMTMALWIPHVPCRFHEENVPISHEKWGSKKNCDFASLSTQNVDFHWGRKNLQPKLGIAPEKIEDSNDIRNQKMCIICKDGRLYFIHPTNNDGFNHQNRADWTSELGFSLSLLKIA